MQYLFLGKYDIVNILHYIQAVCIILIYKINQILKNYFFTPTFEACRALLTDNLL